MLTQDIGRRVWARIGRDGAAWIVGRSDRWVDNDREFGRLVDELVALRGGTPAAPR